MSVEKPAEKAPPNYRTLTPEGPRPPLAPTTAAKPLATAKPAPAPATEKPAQPKDKAQPDPTRFGDWEVKGRCIDF
ncbi:MAG TPA: DUF1674 domain-containing protein [Alphaproteobacteria bacterium]|nr:DUF1674 domain-containing protein [Alphaproteobacteria bacterium]